MTEKTDHPNASNTSFPYFFANAGTEDHSTTNRVHGIDFGDLVVIIPPSVSYKYRYDLALYYGDLQNTYVEGRCSRWDVQDYDIIVGTWIKKDELKDLKNNIRPGAVKQLNRVINSPKFYDSSWQGYNTLRFLPTPSSSEMNHSTLRKMRRETIAYCKTITEHPIEGSDWIDLKLECSVSGEVL